MTVPSAVFEQTYWFVLALLLILVSVVRHCRAAGWRYRKPPQEKVAKIFFSVGGVYGAIMVFGVMIGQEPITAAKDSVWFVGAAIAWFLLENLDTLLDAIRPSGLSEEMDLPPPPPVLQIPTPPMDPSFTEAERVRATSGKDR